MFDVTVPNSFLINVLDETMDIILTKTPHEKFTMHGKIF